MSPLYLASIWFLPMLLKEVIPSQMPQSQFWVPNCITWIALLITGVCTLEGLFPVSLHPSFPCLYLNWSSLFLLSFQLLPEQGAEWRAPCCFPLCFFSWGVLHLLSRNKMNQQPHVTCSRLHSLCQKEMDVNHSPETYISHTQPDMNRFYSICGSSLCKDKGTGSGSWAKFTSLWASFFPDQWESLCSPCIPTGTYEMHIKNLFAGGKSQKSKFWRTDT